MEGPRVRLITKEGTSHDVDRDLIVKYSVFVKGQIDDNPEEPVVLPEIADPTLGKVLEFLGHLKDGNPAPDIEKPLRSNDMKDVTTEWFADFIDHDDNTVQDIILAANFLDIKELLTLSCAKLGSVIRGMSIQEFRKRFDIVNDFTPEEEAEPYDEARLAEQAEAYEKEQEAKNREGAEEVKAQ